MKKQFLKVLFFISLPSLFCQPFYAMEQTTCTCAKNVLTDTNKFSYGASKCSHCCSKILKNLKKTREEARRQIAEMDKFFEEIKRDELARKDRIHRWQLAQSPITRKEWQDLMNRYESKPVEQDNFLPQIIDFPKAKIFFKDGIKELNESEASNFGFFDSNRSFNELNENGYTIPTASFADLSVTALHKLFESTRDYRYLKSLDKRELSDVIKIADFLNLKKSDMLYRFAGLKKLDQFFPSVALFKKKSIQNLEKEIQSKLQNKTDTLELCSDVVFLADVESIKNNPQRKKIKKLDLSNNNLEKLSLKKLIAIFPNLSKIDLCNNKISTVSRSDWQTLVRHPLHINLTNNNIPCIDYFEGPVPEAGSLCLRYNQISNEQLEKFETLLHPTWWQRNRHSIYTSGIINFFGIWTLYCWYKIHKTGLAGFSGTRTIDSNLDEKPWELSKTIDDFFLGFVREECKVISSEDDILTYQYRQPTNIFQRILPGLLYLICPIGLWLHIYWNTQFWRRIDLSDDQPYLFSKHYDWPQREQVERINRQLNYIKEQQKLKGSLGFKSFAVSKKD